MVYLFLAEGFEEIEALTVVDILRRAQIDIKTVSITDEYKVCGSHGIAVIADVLIKDTEKAEMLILPGGIPGTPNLKKCKKLEEMLKEAEQNGNYIAAICAAPSVLGEFGLLKGKKAICYPGFEKSLEGAEVTEEKVVVSGNAVTSRGAGTASDFAFAIVGLLKDEETAMTLKKNMLF